MTVGSLYKCVNIHHTEYVKLFRKSKAGQREVGLAKRICED